MDLALLYASEGTEARKLLETQPVCSHWVCAARQLRHDGPPGHPQVRWCRCRAKWRSTCWCEELVEMPQVKCLRKSWASAASKRGCALKHSGIMLFFGGHATFVNCFAGSCFANPSMKFSEISRRSEARPFRTRGRVPNHGTPASWLHILLETRPLVCLFWRAMQAVDAILDVARIVRPNGTWGCDGSRHKILVSFPGKTQTGRSKSAAQESSGEKTGQKKSWTFLNRIFEDFWGDKVFESMRGNLRCVLPDLSRSLWSHWWRRPVKRSVNSMRRTLNRFKVYGSCRCQSCRIQWNHGFLLYRRLNTTC